MLANPTIPDSVPSRAVHVKVHGCAGERVILESPALRDASGSLLLPEAAWSEELDADGEATLTVPRTDADTTTPTGWTYAVIWSPGVAVPGGSLTVPDGVGTLEFESAFTPSGEPTSGQVTYATAAQLATEAAARVAGDAAEAVARADADAAESAARAAADGTLAAGLATLDDAITGDGGVGDRLTAIEGGTASLVTVNTQAGATIGGLNFFEAMLFGGAFSYPGPPAPETGPWELNTLVVDSNARWWRCTVAGMPATWATAS